MLRRVAGPGARRRARRRARGGRGRPHRARRGARARRLGRGGPQRGGGRVRLARVRATAYPKLTLSLRVLGRRADGYHDLESLVVSLGQPHDVLEVVRGARARGRAGRGAAASRSASDVPTDHRNLAFIAAEKLLVRAGRSGHGVRLVLRKHIPAGGGPRRRFGRRRGRAARGARAARRRRRRRGGAARSRPRSVPTCRSACAGGAAWMRGRGEIIEPVSLPRRAPVPRGDPAVPAVDPRRVPRRGTSSAARGRERVGARAASAVAGSSPSWSTTSSRRPRRVEPRLVEFRGALEAATGRAALLAGSGSAYVVPVADARRLPGLVDAGRPAPARARGRHDERRRGVRAPAQIRSADSVESRRRRQERRSVSGPADDAASVSSSAASCASSSACACGAS